MKIQSGILFILSGPSGVGKSTLTKSMLSRIPNLTFSISATTRPQRIGEEDGQHYDFVSNAEFDELLASDSFLESATVYGNRYGTLREPVESSLANGRWVLLDVDVEGARQVRRRKPEAISVYILPQSLAVLEDRLRSRGTDSNESIMRRMAQAEEQLAGAEEYDYLIVNHDVEMTVDIIQGILTAEVHRTNHYLPALNKVRFG